MNANFFFEEMGVSTALYYIDTQKIELALLQKDFQEARRLLSESVVPPGIDLIWYISVINTFSSFTRKPATTRGLITICRGTTSLMILSGMSVSGCVRQT